jgi:hypothetical protein
MKPKILPGTAQLVPKIEGVTKREEKNWFSHHIVILPLSFIFLPFLTHAVFFTYSLSVCLCSTTHIQYMPKQIKLQHWIEFMWTKNMRFPEF